jgi:hypothetical protein
VPSTWVKILQQSSTIGHQHSSYSAEGTALIEALLNKPNTIPVSSALGVFTDSLSNLLTINRGVAKAQEQQELFSLLEREQTLSFYHTRSHNGIFRNEEVDKLCDLSRTDPERRTIDREGRRTASKARSWTKSWISAQRKIDLSKLLAIDSQTTRLMELILADNIVVPPEHKSLTRRAGVLLSKARTNRWTNCQWFLNYINVEENPNCTTCEVKDTTLHLLNNCKRHDDERSKLITKCNYSKVTQILMTRDSKELAHLSEFLCAIDDARSRASQP